MTKKIMNLNADEVLINNNQLANTSLNNLNDKGKRAFLTSNTFINLNLDATLYNGVYFCDYIAPANGYIEMRAIAIDADGFVAANIVNNIGMTCQSNSISDENRMFLPVRTGDSINMSYNGDLKYIRFYYLESEV